MLNLALMLVVAFGLDGLLGDPHSNRHPVALLGRLAAKIETICRKFLGNGILGGACAWLVTVAATMIPVFISVWLVNFYLNAVLAAVISGVWLYFCIALRSLQQHANAIYTPLAAHDLAKARKALSMIVSRDTATLGEAEIVRGTVESLGENLVDAVNSAVFWAVLGFVLGGAPLAAALTVVLRAINTLDACWGYKNAKYLRFGRIAARMDDVMHFIPARLSLLTTALAAPCVKGSVFKTFKTGIKYRKCHTSPNSAWGMAAFAGALGIRLGGPTVYDGVTENNPYLGTGRLDLTALDIIRAQKLAAVGAILFALCMLLLAFAVLAIAHNV